jgi:hypothetical protein
MIGAVISDGRVINLIRVESIEGMPDVVDGEGAQIGDAWDGQSFVEPVVAPQPVAVPASVSRRQGRMALLLSGLLDAVVATIAAIEDPIERGLAQIEWEDAQTFERDWPLVLQMQAKLDLDLDALFIQAAAL